MLATIQERNALTHPSKGVSQPTLRRMFFLSVFPFGSIAVLLRHTVEDHRVEQEGVLTVTRNGGVRCGPRLR